MRSAFKKLFYFSNSFTSAPSSNTEEKKDQRDRETAGQNKSNRSDCFGPFPRGTLYHTWPDTHPEVHQEQLSDEQQNQGHGHRF